MEQITGIVTGSTYANDNTVNFSLMASGLKGEGHMGNDNWFIKSHFPGIAPHLGAVKIKKCITGIRNPFDTMMSYLNFKLTFSHTKSVSNEFTGKFKEEWEWFLQQSYDMWDESYTYWRHTNKDAVPIYYYRYEDLVTHPKQILEEMICFALGVESIEGTYIQKRIIDVTTAGANSVCKPRQGGVVANINAPKYSEE
jgi:hypothetical protein